MEKNSDKNIFCRAVPLAADGLAFVLHLLLLPALSSQLQARSMANVLVLAAIYVLFCLSVYVIRKLEESPARVSSGPLAHLLSSRTQGAFGLLFGVFTMFVVLFQIGYLDALPFVNTYRLGSPESAVFFAFAPGAWLALSLFYVLILISNFETTIRLTSNRYPWLAFFGLLGSHGMLLLATAQGQAIGQQLAANTNIGGFLILYALLLLLFGPPRLLYWTKQPHFSSVASFPLLLAYCAWQMTT